MKRLDERLTLEHLIGAGQLQPHQVERLVQALARFYRGARPTFLPPAVHLADLRQSLAYNRRVLLDRRFGLPSGLVWRIDRIQRRFLASCGGLIAARLRHRRIVDGHGDLRPEHIWLDDKVRIIDCLEFNPRLRVVDPFDEIAYLSLECERLGAAWVGDILRRRMKTMLRDGPAEALFAFYHCYRATLRARLAIAHLYEAQPRTPEKWPRRAAEYLALAERGARELESWLRTR
jgi:aminoglycoside phosphotransferase family enzyme